MEDPKEKKKRVSKYEADVFTLMQPMNSNAYETAMYYKRCEELNTFLAAVKRYLPSGWRVESSALPLTKGELACWLTVRSDREDPFRK